MVEAYQEDHLGVIVVADECLVEDLVEGLVACPVGALVGDPASSFGVGVQVGLPAGVVVSSSLEGHQEGDLGEVLVVDLMGHQVGVLEGSGVGLLAAQTSPSPLCPSLPVCLAPSAPPLHPHYRLYGRQTSLHHCRC